MAAGMVAVDGTVVGGMAATAVVGMVGAVGMVAAGMAAVGVGEDPDIGEPVITLMPTAILIGVGAAATGVVVGVVGAAVIGAATVADGVATAVGAVTAVAGAAVTGASRTGKLPKNVCGGGTFWGVHFNAHLSVEFGFSV
jgi:hypothetical protein